VRHPVSRRSFVKAAGAGAALAATGSLAACGPREREEATGASPPEQQPEQRYGGHKVEAHIDQATGEVTVNPEVIVRYSACLGCYSTCGNRVHIDRTTGAIMSVGGNPYSPCCAYPPLAFDEPLDEAYRMMGQARGNQVRATVCGRGNGTLDAYAQPGRITTPLKRAGARGEGKWEAISWEQLIDEVVEGGKLFEHIGEDRLIEGFRALRDTEAPLDPAAPELGPKSNQLVVFGGRGDGRAFVARRFATCFGSVNWFNHGSTCGGAKDILAFMKGAQDVRNDFDHAEYVLCLGGFPGASGKTMQAIARHCSSRLADGSLSMDILDPVLCNGVVTPTQKQARWLPIKTATNTAFALGLIRWILENDAHNKDFMSFPNYRAACEGGYASFCNATHLVITDPGHPNHRRLMRAEDAGLSAPEVEDPAKPEEHFVVIDASSGQPALHRQSTRAQLEYEGSVNGIAVRSAFLFLKDSAFERSIDEIAALCEVPSEEIARIAKEFTSHGTRASVYGLAPSSAVNGVDAANLNSILAAFIGSDLMKGGTVPWRASAKTTVNGDRYLLDDIDGVPKVSALPISRTGVPYEKTSEYHRKKESGEDTTPPLPWFPLARISDSQALISVVNQYPYSAKIMLSWMTNVLQGTSGAMRESIIDRLKDPGCVPLSIACDVVMGEHASLADYLVPDTTPYESFGIVTSEGHLLNRGNTVRWPVVEPLTETLPDGRHASFEAFVCDVAQACALPGFGENALKSVDGSTYPFKDAADLFLKGVANLAWDTAPVADIAEGDLAMQGLDGLPEQWKTAVTEEEWPKVLNVLSRGGRFWPAEDAFKGEASAYGYELMTLLYNEGRATNGNSLSGATASGTLVWRPETFADLSPIAERYTKEEWPLSATNYKPRFRSVSMLANSPLMRDLSETNYLEVNTDDAERFGLSDGDIAQLSNPSGDVMEAPVLVRAGIARGTVGVAYGYGHRAYGAQDIEISGETIPGDAAIAAGINLCTMLDPTVPGVFPLSDPEAGSPGRNGGAYRITK
jgi:tetrathionate reductase subunit A